MAKLNVFTLENLTMYDSLIKQYINAGDAKSIKHAVVEGRTLKLFKSEDVQESEFVMSKFGIPGVCEPSALITAGYDSELIYKKTAFDGVTVSVAIENKKISKIR